MRRFLKNGNFLLAFLLPWLWAAAVEPESVAPAIGLHKNTPRVTAFVNARIVQAPGKVLERATLVVRDGCIEAAGADAVPPKDAVVLDLAGKTLYPGFIDPYTHYGVPVKGVENTGVRHWNDQIRTELRAAELFLPDDKIAAVLRGNGFAATAVFPRAGVMRGCGALVLTGDEGPSARVFADSIGQALSFSGSGDDYPGSLMGCIALIRQTFLDARWYSQACEAYRAAPTGREAPDEDRSLEALLPCALGTAPAMVETEGLLDIFRAADLARELGLNFLAIGSGVEYERIDAVKRAGVRLILPVNFPEAPDAAADDVSLRDLRRWDFAPENPARMEKAGIDFALTAWGMDKPENFLKNMRLAVKRGLSTDTALRALTVTPAAWLGQSQRLGTLEKGKTANFIVTDGDLFAEKTKILDTWVAGERYEVTVAPEADVRGTWTLRIVPPDSLSPLQLEIGGEADKPETHVSAAGKKVKALKTALDKRLFTVVFPADSLGRAGVVRLSGIAAEGALSGRGTWPDGSDFTWEANLKEPWKDKPDTAKVEPPRAAEFPAAFPESPFGRAALPVQPEALLVRNATVWTCGPKGSLKNTDILVRRGKIAEVGRNLDAPAGAVVIDAAGKHVTPGFIDAHSHMAISGDVNESSHSITSEVRIRDVLNAEDVAIYRHLAFGLTSACVCHGSANAIGGQNVVIKLRWGALPDDLTVEGQTPFQKFALGENVKQSNITGRLTRYPSTRMGVEQFMRDSFLAAKDYQRKWKNYTEKEKKDKTLIPPRRDLRLEPLTEILEGKRQIQCHAYRQDEMLALMRIGDDLGFKVGMFIHTLEGYKIADALKAHGTSSTVFMDPWESKAEMFDGIPYNAALMREQGVLASLHSDYPVMFLRLNQEAAKAVKYGGVPEDKALELVTINPARQLHLDDRMGSIEKGKDADFVIWNGNPLSVYSACEQTWIDGRRYFDVEEDRQLRAEADHERAVLLEKTLKAGGKGEKK